MAALLVALSVMSIVLAALMPVWKTTVQREREEELVFRGEQYKRAIGLFQRRNGPGVYPPSFDVLVDQKYLRKKFKDPITGEDFLPLVRGQAGTATTPGSPTGQNAPGTSGAVVQPQAGSTFSLGNRTSQPGTRGGAPVGATGGIMGVVSRSKDKSFRLYDGRSHYNEWQFIYVQQTQTPGSVPGAATPGARPGQQPGQGGVGPGGRRGPGQGGAGPGMGRPGTTGVPTGTGPRPQPQSPRNPQQPIRPGGPGR